jgi:hypothetical protein
MPAAAAALQRPECLMQTEEAAEVSTTRRTVPAFAHDLITFRIPRTDGSIWSFCTTRERARRVVSERQLAASKALVFTSGFSDVKFTGAATRKA